MTRVQPRSRKPSPAKTRRAASPRARKPPARGKKNPPRTVTLKRDSVSEFEGPTSEVAGLSDVAGEAVAGEAVVGPHDFDFVKPIPLDGIPADLQEKMFVVAPVLGGAEAEYTAEFFAEVVGLDGDGVPFDKVMVDSPLTYQEIFQSWQPAPRDKYRFPLANCTNSEMRDQFALHYMRVYGSRPDNKSFSLKFLRACYASFVYHMDVNWVAEAVKTRRRRVVKGQTNPHKLGPLALRDQLTALCRLIADTTQAPTNSADERPDESSVKAKIKDYKLAKKVVDSALEWWRGHLQESKDKLTVMCRKEESLKEQ